MDAFLSANNTFIVERTTVDGDKLTTRLPVVGWVYVQGTRAYPICPLAYGGLTDKRAVLMPSGMVCDVFFDATFESLEAWENACDIKGAIDRRGSADPDTLLPDRTRTADELRRPNPADAAATQAKLDRKPKKVKTLQQKSFWGSKEHRAILLAEGGTELPDDRDWVKIDRTEFGVRKKDGYVIWPTENGPAEAAEARPEDGRDGADNLDDLI